MLNRFSPHESGGYFYVFNLLGMFIYSKLLNRRRDIILEKIMSLFSSFAIDSNEERDRYVLVKMNKSFDESITHNTSFWVEGDRDTRVYGGDTSIYGELYNAAVVNRSGQYSFNRVKRVVNMISGRQRQTRKTLVTTPVENADMETADQYTKVLMWINNQDGIDITFSDSCEGSLISGLNLLQIYLDFRSDPVSGNIKVDNLKYNSFMIDPYFRKRDLSDCNYIWTRKFMTRGEIISLLPERRQEIEELSGKDNKDGKFQFLPENMNYNTNNLFAYDEFYYKDFRKQKLLIDTETGETQEWRFTNKEDNLKSFLRAFPQITLFEQEIPTVKLAIVVNNKVMYNSGNPLGIDEYPFVPVFAYYTPELTYYSLRIQGVVRGLRDAQYLYNQRRCIEDDILRSTVNSGFIYKENALVNPKDIFMTGQGKGIALKDDAQMTDVVQIPSPAIHPSVFQVSENYAKEMNEITGLSEENLAASSEDIAGVLAMLRQGAGLIGLQGLFDGWDYAFKLLGRKELQIIQTNFTPGKVKKILEGEEPQPQFYSKAFGVYDVVVEEGLNTATQRQMQMAQMLQLREAGVPIPDDVLLEAATIQDKKKVIESVLKNQEQARQMQEQQMQIEMQKLQADAKLSESRSMAEQGKYMSSVSEVAHNEAMTIEQRARSVRDENAALLDLVKAFKELDTLDIAHLKEMITMQQMIKQQEMVTQGEIETGNVNTATPKMQVSKMPASKTQVSKVKSVKPRKKKNEQGF